MPRKTARRASTRQEAKQEIGKMNRGVFEVQYRRGECECTLKTDSLKMVQETVEPLEEAVILHRHDGGTDRLSREDILSA